MEVKFKYGEIYIGSAIAIPIVLSFLDLSALRTRLK